MHRILLISDLDGEAEVLASVLRSSNGEIIRPRTMEAALRVAQRNPPDLVVLALRGEAAWTLTRQLKADPVARTAPIMVFREAPSDSDKNAARAAGVDSYDSFPPNPERVLAKIEALLRDRRPITLQPVPVAGDAAEVAENAGRILIVDDDASLLELMARRLALAHYDVMTANGGREALDLLESRTFDLVLLDLTMPGVSGLEVLWRLREQRSSTDLPVIIVTGKTHAHDVVGALELGANDYVTKPVDFAIVMARINIHLNLRKATDRLRESEARYRLIAEYSTDMVTRSTVDGTWRYVSPACRHLLGYEPGELIGRSAYDFIHPDDFVSLAESLETGAGSPDMFSLRYRMLRKDDRWVWLDTTIHALRDPRSGEVSELLASARDVTAQVEKQNALVEEIMVRFARIAEFRSGETSGHIQRMSHSCGILARRYGLGGTRAEQIRLAATLHDFGNVLIPMEILHKEGALTDAEFEVMKQGPELGYELLRGSGIEVLELAASISWTHHEHWDGSGYPRGRRAKGIPIEGRIALICDSFDMMTSDRPYRAALPIDVAVAEMTRGRGLRFDPELLDQFLAELDEILALRSRFPDGG